MALWVPRTAESWVGAVAPPGGDGPLAAEPPPQAVGFQDKRPEERLRGARSVGRGWGLGLAGRAKLGAE